MRRIQEVEYDTYGAVSDNSTQILVERVSGRNGQPTPQELAEDRGRAGRKAFEGSWWLRTVAQDAGSTTEWLARKAFPLSPQEHAKRIALAQHGGSVAFWAATTFEGRRSNVIGADARSGFMTTETHVRGPRLLRPLLSRIGRFVTVNVTELVVHPLAQRRGIATALADAAFRDLPVGTTVRFSVPEASVVDNWVDEHDLRYHHNATQLSGDDSPVGAPVWMVGYEFPVEQLHAELQGSNDWLRQGIVRRG